MSQIINQTTVEVISSEHCDLTQEQLEALVQVIRTEIRDIELQKNQLRL